jgi:hypothetical protein
MASVYFSWGGRVLGLGSGGLVPEPALLDAALSSGMLIDTAARPVQLFEMVYASTLAREFNMMEPEDTMKWEVVHPEPRPWSDLIRKRHSLGMWSMRPSTNCVRERCAARYGRGPW